MRLEYPDYTENKILLNSSLISRLSGKVREVSHENQITK